MRILITGTAGFIGFHLVNRLLPEGHDIVGLDNINDYYDVNLKLNRLRKTGIEMGEEPSNQSGTLLQSSICSNYRFIKLDLNDREKITELFELEQFDAVIHLAAQAGVRYSLENPSAYIDSNISGFLNILEGSRHTDVDHLIYASSSSVYGSNKEMPFKTTDRVDYPVSLYAASKKSNELMAYTYSHLFGLPTTGLRFFTVYGPWGRPDMALFLFTKAILRDQPIDVYNYGEMARDFTYIDDIVEGVARMLTNPPFKGKKKEAKKEGGRAIRQAGKEELLSSGVEGGKGVPYQLFNIGYGSPVNLMDFISEIEKNLGIEAQKNMMEIQPGDVPRTWADVEDLFEMTGYRPQVSIEEGVRRFIEWYKEYYRSESR